MHWPPVHPAATTQAAFEHRFRNVIAGLRALESDPGVTMLDMAPVLCAGGSCSYVEQTGARYADYGHLSTRYARTLGPVMAGAIARATKP